MLPASSMARMFRPAGFLSGEATDPPADVYTTCTGQRSPTRYPIAHGLAFSGGLDFRTGHLRFSPELRYVHWNRPLLDRVSGDGSFSCTQRRMSCPSYSASRGTDIYRFFSVTPTP